MPMTLAPRSIARPKFIFVAHHARFPYRVFVILTTVLLEFPVSVVQGADLTRLQPSRDAVEMEGMLVYVRADSQRKTRRKWNVRYRYPKQRYIPHW